jgi:hypothetical protein
MTGAILPKQVNKDLQTSQKKLIIYPIKCHIDLYQEGILRTLVEIFHQTNLKAQLSDQPQSETTNSLKGLELLKNFRSSSQRINLQGKPSQQAVQTQQQESKEPMVISKC